MYRWGLVLICAAGCGRFGFNSSDKSIDGATNDGVPSEGAQGPVTIFLTSGASWLVPNNFNSANNTIE
jgi:hypothetical protein